VAAKAGVFPRTNLNRRVERMADDDKQGAEIKVSEDVTVVMIPADSIKQNSWNPNDLDDRTFNRLTDDIQRIGFLQPILVTPQEGGIFRIVDGEHRFECAKLLDMEMIPCVVLDGDFAKDETAQKFQTMRMNLLRGTVDKRKLQALVQDLATNMPIEEVAEGMAFDDVDALRALIDDARRDLPPEMRKEFDKAKEEIKTVEDLSLVLNRLFTKYGSTLPYNYMIMDFGGKEHIWVRLKDKKAYKQVKSAAEVCREKGVTFSSAMMALVNDLTPTYVEKHRYELEEVKDDEQHSEDRNSRAGGVSADADAAYSRRAEALEKELQDEIAGEL
jgi:hypothetical protein